MGRGSRDAPALRRILGFNVGVLPTKPWKNLKIFKNGLDLFSGWFYAAAIGRSAVFFRGIPHPHLLGDRTPF
jgi:hypothetical protein